VVFDWPVDGRLMLPGLKTEIAAAGVVVGGKLQPITWKAHGTWTELHLPSAMPDCPAAVVALKLKEQAKVDSALGIHPNMPVKLLVEFAEVSGADKKEIRWMEKFGEWKFSCQAGQWSNAGKAVWTVEVCEAGDCRVELTYKGEDRLAWRLETDEGIKLQNQQNASPVYHTYPMGLLTFCKPGKHTLTVSLVEGNHDKASLEAVRLSPAQ
jgi:alpha-L-fucosidase